mmetsp:Transcript_101170/g.286714  ORF Transcript_101170/g.286714 Transcript_101170/m.286714 type:complete len:210 (+) Transcript_101170:300-929(+)
MTLSKARAIPGRLSSIAQGPLRKRTLAMLQAIGDSSSSNTGQRVHHSTTTAMTLGPRGSLTGTLTDSLTGSLTGTLTGSPTATLSGSPTISAAMAGSTCLRAQTLAARTTWVQPQKRRAPGTPHLGIHRRCRARPRVRGLRSVAVGAHRTTAGVLRWPAPRRSGRGCPLPSGPCPRTLRTPAGRRRSCGRHRREKRKPETMAQGARGLG